MVNRIQTRFLTTLALGVIIVSPVLAAAEHSTPVTKDIRTLSQDFISSHGISPWMFFPKDNIKKIDTTEHPGYLTIWEAGRGEDIKGVLKDPIRINDYPLPWEFQLGFVQNAQALKGISENQINYAIGLNLVVTFSDPATWPKDRTQLPLDAHSLQVFVVHLGSVGEVYRPGVPGVRETPLNYSDPSPEVYLVYGRGDLAPNADGNWRIPYTWEGPAFAPGQAVSGSTSKEGGPASPAIRFIVRLDSPTLLEVGFGNGLQAGWRTKRVDVSRFGRITGVWEIGPILSLDKWIPHVLAPQLGLGRPPAWVDSLAARYKWLGGPTEQQDVAALSRMKTFFKIDAPDPSFEYYIDYADFYEDEPENIADLSTDFNIPGFLADQRWYQEGNAISETFSHPGYLTVTQYGNGGGWAMCPIQGLTMDLKHFKPPWEIEISFIPPDDSSPWNFWMTPALFDAKGKNLGQGWTPGVQNIPNLGTRFINHFGSPYEFQKSPTVNLEFEKPVPQSVMTHKPLDMLVQVVDASHLRVGFRAGSAHRWYFSKPFDTEKAFGRIGQIQSPCFASFQGEPGESGWGVGNYPRYEQFLIKYVHFRYGLSGSTSRDLSSQSHGMHP
jgi:hypothetical protein